MFTNHQYAILKIAWNLHALLVYLSATALETLLKYKFKHLHITQENIKNK